MIVSAHPLQVIKSWVILAVAFLFWCGPVQAETKWNAVAPEELADNKPHVDPNAGAEILYREVTIDRFSSRVGTFDFGDRDTHYVRIKVYNQRGVDDLTKIDLECDQNSEVYNIAARTIKPDGSIIELNPKDVYTREIIKYGSEHLKAKSFAPPGLVPGAIIEYQYSIANFDHDFFIGLFFQADLPTQKVQFKIRRPNQSYSENSLRTIYFNCSDMPLEKSSHTYFTVTRTNVPAEKVEPYSIPRLNAVMAILIYSANDHVAGPEGSWKNQSAQLYQKLDYTIATSKAIRTTLASIILNTDSPNEKLRKIHDYCRSKIINFDHDASVAKAHQPKDKNPIFPTATEILKAGEGDPVDVNTLFAAFARAAGFEVRYIACSDRSKLLFDPRYDESWAVPYWAVAVLVDGKWQYFDPGAHYLPANMLRWQNTDTMALIAAQNGDGQLRRLESAPAEANTHNRTATFNLDDEGSLEGDVTETFTGLWEADLKTNLEEETEKERADVLPKILLPHLSSAELSNIKVENATDPLGTLRISYHLHLSNFADNTGSRLFVQPAVFQKGTPPLLENTPRSTDLYFHYKYTEKDEIRINYPEGYQLEQGSAPSALDLGELGNYKSQITILSHEHALTYSRTYRHTCVAISKSYYPLLVNAYQGIYKRDNHTLTLKRRTNGTDPTELVSPMPPSTPSESSNSADGPTHH